jgi:DNA-binding transcriptional MocR family regulator
MKKSEAMWSNVYTSENKNADVTKTPKGYQVWYKIENGSQMYPVIFRKLEDAISAADRLAS